MLNVKRHKCCGVWPHIPCLRLADQKKIIQFVKMFNKDKLNNEVCIIIQQKYKIYIVE